jgi:hypothetical protein
LEKVGYLPSLPPLLSLHFLVREKVLETRQLNQPYQSGFSRETEPIAKGMCACARLCVCACMHVCDSVEGIAHLIVRAKLLSKVKQQAVSTGMK